MARVGEHMHSGDQRELTQGGNEGGVLADPRADPRLDRQINSVRSQADT